MMTIPEPPAAPAYWQELMYHLDLHHQNLYLAIAVLPLLEGYRLDVATAPPLPAPKEPLKVILGHIGYTTSTTSIIE
jgi:hypothetical protein